MDYATVLASALRQPRPLSREMQGSVMSQPSQPDPAISQDLPLENVSPEDWIPNPKSAVLALGGALKGMPLLAGMAKLKHGSSAVFQKFDPAKILSGEGNTSFGHGVYLAESPKVAEHYANVAAEANNARIFDKRAELAANIAALRAQPVRGQVGMSTQDRAEMLRRNAELQKEISAVSPRKIVYDVDVPDEVLGKTFDLDANMPRYAELLKQHGGSHEQASAVLRGEGFTGTSYLDAASRKSGGSKNYVIFDPEHLSILGHKEIK